MYRMIQLDTIAEDVQVYGDPEVDFYAALIVYRDGNESLVLGSEDDAVSYAATAIEATYVRSSEVVIVG